MGDPFGGHNSRIAVEDPARRQAPHRNAHGKVRIAGPPGGCEGSGLRSIVVERAHSRSSWTCPDPTLKTLSRAQKCGPGRRAQAMRPRAAQASLADGRYSCGRASGCNGTAEAIGPGPAPSRW